MLLRYWCVVLPALMAAASVCAQGAERDAAEPDAAASAAEAASSAMARARRQAAGPMRFILEASRARRRATEAEPAAPADTASVRAVSNRSASPAPEPAEAPGRREAQAPVASAAPVVPAAPEADAVLEITLNSQLLQLKAPAPAPALSSSVAAVVAPPAGVAMPMPKIGVGPVRPTLVSHVQPDVSRQVLDELGSNAVVPVDITIRADGTVSAVALAGPAPRRLLRPVQVAVQQWRFEPLPSERVHRVELVFNPDR